MPSTAISAQGTTVQVDNVTPGTADVAIDNVKSFSGFDGESSEIDTTNLVSTAKEYRLGLQDFGNFQMEYDVDYSSTGQDVLRAAQASGDTKTFLLTFPDASTATFQAIVKNAQSLSGGVDQVLTGSASLRITGAVTFA